MQAQRLNRTPFVGSSKPVAAVQRLVGRVNRQTLQVVCSSAVAQPASVPLKGVDGSDKGSQKLALKVAGEDTAKALVHRYMVLVNQNARRGTASTLTKSEVRGGGRKPYAQKGTGNARRGSSTSPLMPGGGITFGPKPKDWSIKMNKKERRLALATALQSAACDMTVLESLAVEDKKTKSLLATLKQAGVNAGEKKVLLIVKDAAASANVILAGRNVEKLYINTADKIKIFDVLKADKIVVESAALEHIQSFYGGAEEADQ